MLQGSGLDAVRAAVRAEVEHKKPTTAVRMSRPIVTLSRETGTGVKEVARRLAAVLDERMPAKTPWLIYGRELVTRVSEDHNLSVDLVKQMDERDKSWFEHLTAGLSWSDTGLDVPMKIARTIRALSRVGHAIIVGRGGQTVLRDVPHAVHVRLIAPPDWRVEHFAGMMSITPEEARKQITATDRDRSAYVKKHFRRDIGDPLNYDLLINRARIDAETAARLIAEYVVAEHDRDPAT